MAEKLTQKFAESLPPPTDGKPYRLVFDTEVRGFGVRVTKAGALAWVFNFRTLTRIERRMTIGDVSDWPIKLARDEARRLRRIVDQGGDPLAERRERRSAPTINDLIEQWRIDVAPKKRPRTRQEYEGLLRQWVLPKLGKRKVADVTRSDVIRLHTAISEGAPVRANRCIALLSTLFSVAVNSGQRPDNPAARIERNHEDPRQRYLKGEEMVRLAAALAARSGQASNAIRLLLLTGARRGELLAARWDQFDDDLTSWTKPAAATKQRRAHAAPLSAPARLLLAEIRGAQDPPSAFVFPSRSGHLLGLKRTWAAICREADLRGIRLHDLRHSFASIAASGGASLPLIGALLGHMQPRTTARYAHLFDDAQRAVVERVGAIIDAADGGAEIVRLRKP